MSPICWRPWWPGSPCHAGQPEAPLRALIFDSYFDRYRGAIPSVRVVDGTLREGMEISFGAHPEDVYTVAEVGYLQLGQRPTGFLEAGEVGYVVANTRSVGDTRAGDTILDAQNRATELLPGLPRSEADGLRRLYPTDQRAV